MHTLWEGWPVQIDEFKNEDEHFAENVRREREKRGWSQAEIARRLREYGMEQFHPTTVSRVENGDRPVRLSEAARFADIFETTVADLVANRVEEVEEMVDNLGTMRELKSRLIRTYDHYQNGRMHLKDEAQRFRAWAEQHPDISDDPANKVVISNLLEVAEAFAALDAWKLLDQHEQSNAGEQVDNGEHPEA